MATPPIDLARLPREPGVYRFRDAEGRALYIGRATELRRRVRSYWGSQRDRPRLRRMVPQIEAVEVMVCASEHEASWLERNLLEQSKPRWNRARGGLEVPVYLRMDPGPRTPSLTVVHERLDALPHHGPYLGGTRVRVAVTALASVLPLAYTADALTGAERSMAQARGVGPADRARLVAALEALLARDPEATEQVAGALVERRVAAAAALEFELAGRLQEQLDALAWLTSPQCVTDLESPSARSRPAGPRARKRRPADALTIAGWSAGTLVELGHWDGRIRSWTQRPCPREEAEPLVAATPARWAPLAARNAELAAELGALRPASA